MKKLKLREIEIGENLTWFLIVAIFIIGGGVFEYLKVPDAKTKQEKAVVVEILDAANFHFTEDKAKLRFEDGTKDIVAIQPGYVVGDTILIYR